MKLNDINNNFGTQMQKIRTWMHDVAKMPDEKFSLNKDLTVDVHGDLRVTKKRISVLPIQFREVNGICNFNNNNLRSLKGAPRVIRGSAFFAHNQLESSTLKYLPSIIQGDLHLDNNKITSLQNIHKYVKRMSGGLFVNGNPLTSHILGVLLIPGCAQLIMVRPGLDQAELIINRHLMRGRDIIECQEQLIDAGFAQLARL